MTYQLQGEVRINRACLNIIVQKIIRVILVVLYINSTFSNVLEINLKVRYAQNNVSFSSFKKASGNKCITAGFLWVNRELAGDEI